MNIIGQKHFIATVNQYMSNNQFPRFFIVQGPKGGGKKLLCSYIANKLNALLVPCELSVDAVRDTIDTAVSQTEPILYMWADADNMSMAAKNALLKVTEEPPQNAYFALTTDNALGLLPTILSRGTLFNLDIYSPAELKEFLMSKNLIMKDADTEKNISALCDICSTPQEILNAIEMDISAFYKVVSVLCDRLGHTNLANELKITTMLDTKGDDNSKYNPVLFLRACMYRFNTLMYNTLNPVYSKIVNYTSSCLSDLNSKSLNKTVIIDNWIMIIHQMAESGGLS